jgi:hypothetical protein
MKAIFAIAALFLVVPQNPPRIAPGVYYRSGDSWKTMEILRLSGSKATHTAKMLVPGLTPQIVYVYRGDQAPVRFTDRRPTFLFKENRYLVGTAGDVTPRDVVIAKFDKKKDHRELQVTTGGNMFTFRAGFGKDRAFDVTASNQGTGTFEFTPDQDLAPGEYIVFMGAATKYKAYDFGID